MMSHRRAIDPVLGAHRRRGAERAVRLRRPDLPLDGRRRRLGGAGRPGRRADPRARAARRTASALGAAPHPAPDVPAGPDELARTGAGLLLGGDPAVAAPPGAGGRDRWSCCSRRPPLPFRHARFQNGAATSLPQQFVARQVTEALDTRFPGHHTDPVQVVGEVAATDPRVAAYAARLRAMPSISERRRHRGRRRSQRGRRLPAGHRPEPPRPAAGRTTCGPPVRRTRARSPGRSRSWSTSSTRSSPGCRGRRGSSRSRRSSCCSS